MAKKQILVSDLSGVELENGTAVRIVITGGKDRYELDAARDEVANLIGAGRKTVQRGRRPKEQSAA